jgi:hypothetical protein
MEVGRNDRRGTAGRAVGLGVKCGGEAVLPGFSSPGQSCTRHAPAILTDPLS